MIVWNDLVRALQVNMCECPLCLVVTFALDGFTMKSLFLFLDLCLLEHIPT